ncbi:hypothetical protein [Dactylosporangium sp. NPDC000521]|uniref:hypothetical protein n=1 Tax=Dactylosporangium sp. NPDC000521 TaxID=3363975 RepID=UPI0036A2E6DD
MLLLNGHRTRGEMKAGKRFAVSVAAMAAGILLLPSAAEAASGKEDAVAKAPTVSIVPATATDMPKGKTAFGPDAASPSGSIVAADWVCTVYASDIWQSGDWAEGEGSQWCSGSGWGPQMIRTQIQRERWWGWETVKTDTSSWTTAYFLTLLPGYDCDGDGTYTYRLVTTGWAAGGSRSQDVQSLNYVRFSC